MYQKLALPSGVAQIEIEGTYDPPASLVTERPFCPPSHHCSMRMEVIILLKPDEPFEYALARFVKDMIDCGYDPVILNENPPLPAGHTGNEPQLGGDRREQS